MGRATAIRKHRPALVERLELSTLRPYPNNPREHGAAQLERLGRALQAFGWTAPALIEPDGTLITGHGRVEAAKRLWARGEEIPGLERGRIPVLRVTDLTPAQVRAYRIADNKLAALSRFDDEALGRLLGELATTWPDAASIAGFDPEALAASSPSGARVVSAPAVLEPMVTFTCPVTASARRELHWLLHAEQERSHAPTPGEALLNACTRFLQ